MDFDQEKVTTVALLKSSTNLMEVRGLEVFLFGSLAATFYCLLKMEGS